MKPIFTHDCARCTFLGNVFVGGEGFNGRRLEADLYYSCNQLLATEKQYILRMSSEDSDYICTTSLNRYLTI